MAKHTRRRKKPYRKINSAFQVLPVNVTFALGALTNGTVVTQALTAISDDFWVQSVDLVFALQDFTASEGPLWFGVANGNLTTVEIAEALVAQPSHRADIIPREEARRPVRRIGMFAGLTTEEVYNDGVIKRTSCKFYLAESAEIEAWCQNVSGATLTTGGIVNVNGVVYGEWR